MERQTRLFLFCVILYVCSATVFAKEVLLSAKFEETKAGDEYGYMTGKLYYKYDSKTRTNSRLRLEYDADGTTVSNLYDYKTGAMYSMCDQCTGILITDLADPWYKEDQFYTKYVPSATGVTWYNRTKHLVDEKTFAQVSSILMDDKDSDKNTIQEIYFADGRHFTLSEVVHNPTIPDGKFNVDSNLNCPKATCPIYADLIFVLDNSGSVSGDSWKQGIQFVKDVIDSFTFGEDAVQGAVIQFNGQYYSKACDKKNIEGCEICKNDFSYLTELTGCWSLNSKYCSECEKYGYGGYCYKYKTEHFNFPGYATATIFAGKKDSAGGFYTVTPDPEQGLKKYLGTRPDKIGDTCQGYGLELAMQVLDSSPRRAYEKKPQPIIIAVTDGEDHCPIKTANAAQRLREQYGAFVVEVGVGLNSGCTVHSVEYLKSIASKAGSDDNPAYYDVSDYGAIHTITEKLFKPLCSDFSSQCGPDCLGFCGCGKCFCPGCRSTGPCADSTCRECMEVKCRSDGSTSTGCVRKNISCDKDDGADNCMSYSCNPNPNGSEDRCIQTYDCKPMEDANPQTCRRVSCQGLQGCRLDYDDAFCQNTYALNDKCKTYICARSDDAITPGLEKTGCRLVEDKLQNLINDLEASGEINCVSAECDSATGKTKVIDTCPSKVNNSNCYTSKCDNYGDGYKCQDRSLNTQQDTYCTRYVCEEDGWASYEKHGEDDCREYFLTNEIYNETELLCMTVECPKDADECFAEKISGCNAVCNSSFSQFCLDSSNYEVTQCHHVECATRDVEGIWEPFCNNSYPTYNCFEDASLVELIKNISSNESSGLCCNATCGKDGQCSKICNTAPEIENECLVYKCKNISDGLWKWELVESDKSKKCISDACWHRECIPSEGCKETEICESQTNGCYNFTCSDNNQTCTNTSLLKKSNCTEEICENGNPKPISRIEWCNATDTNKCIGRKCVYDKAARESKCEYYDLEPAENDDCFNYSCDKDSGNWTAVPKCDDGKFCTENVCTIFGECKYPDVTCEELPMDDYPCFDRRCREDLIEKKYVCYRKLIGYVDVCGRCIMEEDEDESSSDSSSHPGMDLTSCTNAPPKPLYTEGLAAASIALIILAAVVVGAAIATSGVMGTKSLIDRAKGANNTSAHSNPLFESADTEMTNPAFAGTAV